MNWAFLIICCLAFGGFVMESIKDGTPRKGKHNALHSFIGTILHLVLILWAMHWRLQ